MVVVDFLNLTVIVIAQSGFQPVALVLSTVFNIVPFCCCADIEITEVDVVVVRSRKYPCVFFRIGFVGNAAVLILESSLRGASVHIGNSRIIGCYLPVGYRCRLGDRGIDVVGRGNNVLLIVQIKLCITQTVFVVVLLLDSYIGRLNTVREGNHLIGFTGLKAEYSACCRIVGKVACRSGYFKEVEVVCAEAAADIRFSESKLSADGGEGTC